MPENIMLVDLIVAAVVLAFAIFGLRKGLSGEIAHIVTLIAVGLALFFVYPYIYQFLYRTFDEVSPQLLKWLLLILLTVLAFFCLGLVSRGLAGMLKTQFSAGTDKFWGFLFGFVRGTFFVVIAIIFAGVLGPPRLYEIMSDRSYAGRFVCYELIPYIQPRVQPHLDNLEKVNKEVKKIQDMMRPEERRKLDE